MIILGAAFLGGAGSAALTPTGTNTINRLEATNAKFDDIYVTANPEMKMDELTGNWDPYTELYAKFDVNINAGNIEYNTKSIDTILVKRRKKGTFKWTTILVYNAEDVNDLIFSGYDYLAASETTYEYAVVPVYGHVENIYYTNEIYSSFDGIHIAELDKIYGTPIGTTCDITRNAPSAVAELINNKYPKYINNTIANYDTGTATGKFVETSCDTGVCGTDFKSTWTYRNDVLAFLTDRKPKILKYETGGMWLINVTGKPTDTGDEEGLSDFRTISFEWVEIGDCDDEATLYYAGLINTPSSYWN